MTAHKNFFKILIIILVLCLPYFSRAQTSALIEHAKLAVIQGNYAEAVISLQSISKENSEYAEACHLLGLAYYESEDYQKAAASLHKAAALKEDDYSIKILLAKANNKLGRTPEAVKILLDIISLDSLNIKAHRNLANIYFKEKDYKDAGRIYDKLLQLNNSKSHLFRQAGLCALKLKQYVKAKNYFHKTLKINPLDQNAYAYLGNTYLKLAEPDAALQIVKNGLNKYPASKTLLKISGDILFEQEKYSAAIEAYVKIVNTKSANASAYNKLGLSYYYLHNYPSALLALQKANKIDSTEGFNLYYLGLTFLKLKNYPKAIHYLEKSVDEIIPSYTIDLYMQLGSCYDNEKKYSKAIKAYKRAMSFDPERKIFLFFIATLYDRYYKDRNTPLEYYQKFLEEDPEADNKFKDYALDRIKAIKEKLHFQK